MARSLPFIYAADELADALSERITAVCAAAELTVTQFKVLYMLVEEGPVRLSDLAEQQRCVKSNVSYITRTMQREGLIELAASRDDQRARVISATKLGLKRYGIARAAAARLEQSLRRALGAEATVRLSQACLDAAKALDSL